MPVLACAASVLADTALLATLLAALTALSCVAFKPVLLDFVSLVVSAVVSAVVCSVVSCTGSGSPVAC